MECAKIKSLLSEYMDKTLENDTAKEVKGHLLSCRECSNDYFLMKTIAQEMRSMERFKAPSNLLNRINLAVQKRPWYLRLPDFIPGSGGFRLPMEYLTLGATAILLFLIITGLYMDKPGAMRVAYNNSTFSDSGSTVSAPVELEFIPVRVKGSDTVSLDNLFSVSSGKALRNSELSDITEMMRLESPLVKQQRLVSHLNELIRRSGGDIISKEHRGIPENIEAITISIPSKGYNSFIQRAEEIGRFHPPAPALKDKRADPVLLRIRLNASE